MQIYADESCLLTLSPNKLKPNWTIFISYKFLLNNI